MKHVGRRRSMTVRDAIAGASTLIARRDAETLLAHLLASDRAWIFAHAEAELTSADLDRLRSLVARRAASEPLQYIIGEQEFYGLRLRVTRDTLIPRPETELLVESVLEWVRAQPNASASRILDVGTGTGAIALALAAQLPDARIVACDISSAALAVATDNAQRLGFGSRIRFVSSDLLDAPELQAAEAFDVVVSNPPYVAVADAATLQPEVVDYEPHTALFAGRDGLDVYRRLAPQARSVLVSGGLLALEFGFGQRDALEALLLRTHADHWQSVHFRDDYSGIPRVALANRC